MWGNEKFLGPVLQKHLCRHDFHWLAFPNRFLPEIAKTRAFPFNHVVDHVVDHVFFLSKRVHVFAPKQTEKRWPKKFRTEFLRCFPTPDSATTETPTARRSSDPTTPTRNNAGLVTPRPLLGLDGFWASLDLPERSPFFFDMGFWDTVWDFQNSNLLKEKDWK